MDQVNIGKFISECRKNKNLTQKELAEKLYISEKTISKWECGKGLPEVSLMKPLCKELDITVTELLNGCRDVKNEETKENSIIEYIDYNKKKSRHKLIILSIISILLITFILSTICYFFNTYNKIAVYELYGENENFIVNEMYLTKSNIYNILYTGQIDLKNTELNKEDIIDIELKCEDTTIYGGSSFENTTYKEKYGYNELLNDYKLNNIDKWIIKITYKENGEKKIDTISLKNTTLMRNNEFISKKSESIGNSLSDIKNDTAIIKERTDIRRQSLLENNYTEISFSEENNTGIFEKNINKKESIQIMLGFSYYPDLTYLYTIKENEIIRIEERVKKENLTSNISGHIDFSETSYNFTYDISTKEFIVEPNDIDINNIDEIISNFLNYRQELYNILNKPFEDKNN